MRMKISSYSLELGDDSGDDNGDGGGGVELLDPFSSSSFTEKASC